MAMGEMYLGSDAIALAPFTDTHHLSGRRRLRRAAAARRREIFNLDGRPVERPAIKSVASSLLVDKGNYRHFMAKEIHEQPEVIGHTLAQLSSTSRKAAWCCPTSGSIPRAIAQVSISACGTAFYAGLVGKYWLERYARLPVEVDVASEFRYREPPLPKGGAGDLHLAVGRDGRYAGGAALLQVAGPAHRLHRQCAHLHHRARGRRRAADARRPGDRRCLDQGVHLPARRAGLPGDRGRPRARHHRRRRRRQELVHALAEMPRHISTLLHDEPHVSSELAHDLAKATRRALSRPRQQLSRWRWKAR